MKRSLRVLIVEDSEDDAELLRRELGRGGYDVTDERVQTAEAMAHALERAPWDLVISDYSMPGFDGLGALAVLERSGVDIPLLVVSGTIGEEAAVAALQQGAYDFIAKNRLARLLPAIERAVAQRLVRAAARRAEEQLRASEARHRELFARNPLPMWVYDTSTLRFLSVNDAAVRHYGYTREEFGRLTLADLRCPEQVGGVGAVVGAGEADCPRRWRHRAKDGSVRIVELHTHEVESERSSERLVLVNDITERLRAEETVRRTEKQLRVAQKLEAVGKLASGVAHDFNNLLTVILSYASLLIDDHEPGDPVRADLEEVRRAGQRAAELTQQLLAFGRQQVLQTKLLDLDELVGRVEKMLRTMLTGDIELSVVPSRALGKVRADASQLERVVVNLVLNARDAMPTGGALTIETRDIDVGVDAEVHPEGEGARVAPGAYVVMTIRDTGTGMDAATRARIFEPFFTTKDVGKGTGLGLSTVFGVVKQSHGHITVQSQPGQGTTFSVYLPREDAREESIPPSTLPVEVFTGTETILLVVDDEQVRAVVRTVLRRNGYHLLEAQNAGEALLICEQHAGTIHLLLSDVVMPRMSGIQLARRVAPLQPAMKVLLTSGYADATVVDEHLVATNIPFLQKPITPAALLTRVRETLDANDS